MAATKTRPAQTPTPAETPAPAKPLWKEVLNRAFFQAGTNVREMTISLKREADPSFTSQIPGISDGEVVEQFLLGNPDVAKLKQFREKLSDADRRIEAATARRDAAMDDLTVEGAVEASEKAGRDLLFAEQFRDACEKGIHQLRVKLIAEAKAWASVRRQKECELAVQQREDAKLALFNMLVNSQEFLTWSDASAFAQIVMNADPSGRLISEIESL